MKKYQAYLNVLEDKFSGKHINSKDIKKHRTFIYGRIAFRSVCICSSCFFDLL